MRRLMIRIIPVFLLTLIGLNLSVRPVLAEDPDWHPFVFDLTTSDYSMDIHPEAFGYTGPLGSWESGFGFHGNYCSSCGYTDLQIHWTQSDILGGATIRNFRLEGASGSGGQLVDKTSYAFSDPYPAACLSGAAGLGTYLVFCEERTDYLNFYYTTFQSGNHPELSFIKVSGEYYGLACVADQSCGDVPTLTRPLTSDDEIDTSPLYDQHVIGDLATHNYQDYQFYPVLFAGGLQTVSAWSKAPGAKVHAADAGTVLAVHPLAPDDCGFAFVSPSTLDTDDPAVTPFITSFQADKDQPCLARKFEFNGDPTPDYADIAKDEYWLDPTDAYIVTLRIGDGSKIQYLVKNAPTYVIKGDTVEAGCVLGETLAITTLPTVGINFPGVAGLAITLATEWAGPEFSFAASAFNSVTGLGGALTRSIPATAAPYGFTALTDYGEDDAIVELASQLTVEPTSDDKCSGTGKYSDCIGMDNPSFSDQGAGWTASGNVDWNEPGVTLGPGALVTAQVNLLGTGDYTATAFVEGVGGQVGQVLISLGTTAQRFDAPVEWTSEQLPVSPLGAPDAGTFYTAGVQNTGNIPINIERLCITDGEPNLGPNSCYFNNQSFIQGTSGWTVSEGVEPVDEALDVPDDGVISQNVKLNPLPGGAATYHLVVRGNWWYNGSMDTTSSASAIAAIQYEWPDGTGYQDMIPINIHGNLAYGAGQLAFMADIPVTTTTDALMNLKVNTTTAGDMGVLGIQITDACLTSPGGGGFPGQGDPPPPINANCSYVSRPQNNDPAAWLQWHWSKMEQFFNCQLMVLLNKMYTLGKQMFLLAGWEMRYSQSTLKLWSAWLGKQLFPWLGGNFRNMAIGQVTTVYQTGGGQCSDLFCVLQTAINGLITPLNNIVNALLGILGGVTGILFSVISGLLTLIVALITQLLGLLQLGQQLLATLVTAYNNAAPVAIPGLPSCSLDPRSSPFCMGIWVLDNTIFSGTGTAIIPMLVGILSIHLLIWVVAELKRTVINVGLTA